MIEATCSACGTQNRVSEANVPAGAKFITCADCKARVALPPPPPGLAPEPSKAPAETARPASATIPPATQAPGGEVTDLPAPKRSAALGPLPAQPTPRSALTKSSGISGLAAALDPELLAPRSMRPGGPTPAPLEFEELLGGVASGPGTSSADIIDLPAPKKATPRPPPEPAREDVIDLPAPKLGRGAMNLPTPKLGSKRSSVDLLSREPAVTTPSALPEVPPLQKGPTISDLPAPQKGPTIPDLPAPRVTDLQPKLAGNSELLAPKGFFDDLPQPVAVAVAVADHDPELLAPKGFFDDLPQPAPGHDPDLLAPKGFFDDLPQAKANPSNEQSDAPAPKGFFDDIPALPHTSKPEAPAPKGFFDDIPALPHTSRPEAPAPKGYFDNIPGRPIKKPDEHSSQGYFEDLPQLARSARSAPEEHAASAPEPAEDGPGEAAGPELDLIAPSDAPSFDDQATLKSTKPTRPEPEPRVPTAIEPRPRTNYATALEGTAPGVPNALNARASTKRPPVTTNPTVDVASVAKPKASSRRNRLVIIGVLAAIAIAAGGGFMLYRRHVAAQERSAAITGQLDIARAAVAASDPQHWQRAATAARHVIELDGKNPEALGIAAEALFASALTEGTPPAAKIAEARALLAAANTARVTGPQLARAHALAELAAHQPDSTNNAITQLSLLVSQAPKDGALALYLGWAFDAKGDPAKAIKSYDTAADDPTVKLAALYGRGNAKLALADLDGARADFAAVLALERDHIGAQIGIAMAQPTSAAQQQEVELLQILARKDLANADPRAVAQAWTRTGTAALRDAHGDTARERFRKALGLVPQDLGALTGLAETELRDGKLAAAAELTANALNIAKDHVPAQLVQSEIEIRQRNFTLAAQRIEALASHVTPLVPLEQARLYLLRGELLEAQGKYDEAVEVYAMGAKIARALDLTPLMAAVKLLASMTSLAIKAQDLKRADQLRARADQLLGDLTEHAEHDPRLAMALGIAYMQAGEPGKAEPWLRITVDARPGDAEARYQLGRALFMAGKAGEALGMLTAASGFDPARADISVMLARTYEAQGRDGDASALYTKLLVGAEPGLEVRARAGRFFARTGAIDQAAEQGAKILAADPSSAAGLYLQGEGQLAAGKLSEARQLFQRAIEMERDPQYLDALGRAAEALARGGDRDLQDLALRSYMAAAETEPPIWNSLVGQGRLYVARHEAAKAEAPLTAAARRDPTNAEVMFLLGAVYQELQQTTTALQSLEASTKVAPRAEAFWRIAQIYHDTNQGPQAADAVANATRLGAEEEKRTGTPIGWLTEALYLQGRINLDLHHDARARDAWTLYVARNPPASAQLTEVKQLLETSLRR